MGIYGTRERTQLATLADQVAAMAGSPQLATAIADKLRTTLPDLDDLTIGRILLALTVEMPQMFTVGDAPTIWQGLTAAGLAMTEPEWKNG